MNAKKEDSPKKGKINIGAVIILIISAVVFLPAGGVAVYQGIFAKNKIPVFGSYNGKKITYERNSKFAMAVSNISEQYRKYGIELNEQTAPYVYNQAFMQTARGMAYSDFVKNSKWTVPESKFDRQLKKLFTDENGKFMKDVYNQMPDSDLNRYKSYIMDDLTVLRFQEDVFGGSSFAGNELYGFKSNDSEEKFIKEMGNEYHSFVLAEFVVDYINVRKNQ